MQTNKTTLLEKTLPDKTTPPEEAKLPEWGDMQGLVLSSYPAMNQASYLLLRIEDGAAGRVRDWLRKVVPFVTPALRKPHQEAAQKQNLNIAFTFSGGQGSSTHNRLRGSTSLAIIDATLGLVLAWKSTATSMSGPSPSRSV